MTSVAPVEISVGALEGFAAAVGAEHVHTDEASLHEFRDPFAYDTWDDYTASAIVMPETVEEVQEIVRVANRFRVPLWTHSTGRNNGYGGGAPRVRGSVVVSLRRMNRVLEIDEELGYAVVEPGVRWFDLYEAIKAGGHKLMVSVPDLGWGSVDREHTRPRPHVSPAGARHGGAVRNGGRACRAASSCAPAWVRCREVARGTSTSAGSGRRPTSCSCSRTSASSRRWASG